MSEPKLSAELTNQWDDETPDTVDWGWITGEQLNDLRAFEAKLSKMEARLEYAEDVLGNVGMDDTLDYLEESWPLAGGDD